MRRLAAIVLIFVFLFISKSSADDLDISLYHQAAIDLCSYPSIREGIIDLLHLNVDKLWHEGKYDRIFPVLKLITTISPDEVETWALGGWFLINAIAPKLSGKEKERVINYAIDFMNKGIEANPEDGRLYTELAMYYYTRQDYKMAISYLDKIEMEHPSYHFLHLKAHIYQKLGRKAEAIDIWERIEKEFPEMKGVAERFIMELENDSGENR